MALAGDNHVVVTIEAKLHCLPGLERGNRGESGKQCGLRFLAAETAAHAPAFDAHLMAGATERVRYDVLHLGRVLGRRDHVNLPVFLGPRNGDLPFEIKMVLPAAAGAPGDAMRRYALDASAAAPWLR